MLTWWWKLVQPVLITFFNELYYSYDIHHTVSASLPCLTPRCCFVCRGGDKHWEWLHCVGLTVLLLLPSTWGSVLQYCACGDHSILLLYVDWHKQFESATCGSVISWKILSRKCWEAVTGLLTAVSPQYRLEKTSLIFDLLYTHSVTQW
jgi:hypothetical protein